MNSQHCCESVKAYFAWSSWRFFSAFVSHDAACFLLNACWRTAVLGMWPFSPQTTDLTHMFNVVNLLPLGLLFSSVSSTPSAQGTVANWHHTGIQDLWDTLSQTEREGAIPQHPSSKSISFFVASVLQQPIISPSAGGTLVTLSQTQFRHEIVLNMVAFILVPTPQHRWLGLEWFFFTSFSFCFCTSYWY